MDYVDAKLLLVILLSLPISAGLALWLARRYRRAMVALMRRSAPSTVAAFPPPSPGPARPVAPDARFSSTDNARRNRHLSLRLAGISLAIGLSTSVYYLTVIEPDTGFGFRRWLILGLIHSWPVMVSLGLLWRWPLWRSVLAVQAYLAALVPVVMLASNNEQSALAVSLWLLSTTLVPMLALFYLTASGQIRAIAPLLFPIVALLLTASILGLDVGAAWTEHPPEWFTALVTTIGAWPTIVLLTITPWLIAAGPAVWLFRTLAQRYRRKAFSELSYLTTSIWLVILTSAALPATHSAGALAFGSLAAILWVPLGFRLFAGETPPPQGVPTLLILRVFQRDAEVEALFDDVTERWRTSGNTILIAGTDLISRTLDADDLFVYLSRRLGERFIATPDQVSARLDEFDLAPDDDGRYRVNECYCTDASWQHALVALVSRANYVLMDLRQFKAHNEGCRIELRHLGQAAHLRRILILHDQDTDRTTAGRDLGTAATQRVKWIDLTGRRADGAQVLSALEPD
ncbi:hypothetical protein [Nitrogeniibacter aestuarii]|uniref:hypothetical protein n=1 Tax=Nitrogeniibacter aestuarii TaxID=2815343 RepID=UPI001E5BF381|nr:hypothetical protein [Nitrogeniibacter aestuarii]